MKKWQGQFMSFFINNFCSVRCKYNENSENGFYFFCEYGKISLVKFGIF